MWQRVDWQRGERKPEDSSITEGEKSYRSLSIVINAKETPSEVKTENATWNIE